jgi:hypothetical protein
MSKLISITRKHLGGDVIRDAIALTGADLGASLALAAKKKKNKKKKKSAKGGMQNRSTPFTSVTSMYQPNPPASAAAQFKTSQSRQTNVLAFDVCHLPIVTTNTGVPVWSDSLSGVFNLPLDPSNSVSGTDIFGTPVRTVSTIYRRFRFRSLQAEYVPIVATSQSGSLTLSCVNDIVSSTAAQTFAQISNYDRTQTTPVWARCPVDMTNLNRDWLWTQDPGVTTTESERLTNAGTLCLASLNSNLAINTTYGLLRLKGVVEFADLGTNATLPSLRRTLDPACSSSVPPSQTYMPGLLPQPVTRYSSYVQVGSGDLALRPGQ